jgi:hypothetical protein
VQRRSVGARRREDTEWSVCHEDHVLRSCQFVYFGHRIGLTGRGPLATLTILDGHLYPVNASDKGWVPLVIWPIAATVDCRAVLFLDEEGQRRPATQPLSDPCIAGVVVAAQGPDLGRRFLLLRSILMLFSISFQVFQMPTFKRFLHHNSVCAPCLCHSSHILSPSQTPRFHYPNNTR